MPSLDDVITEARTWIGTPYHHQQCVKGVGVDCAQLIAGVGHALGLMPMLSRDLVRYSRTPNPRQMRVVIEMFMEPITQADVKFGDVFWMGWKPGLPQHLGFYSDMHGAGMIHSLMSAGRVVETAFDYADRDMIAGWWRYKGISVG